MPKICAWRIDKAKRSASSFFGVGAAKEGGRWNSTDIPVVYVSEHLATAVLEKYIHLTKPVYPKLELVKFSIDFNGVDIEVVPSSSLPVDWQQEPVAPSTQALGDEWAKSRRTAILAVPSAIVPDELNFVLNPSHPDFARVIISAPEAFVLDPRLARFHGVA